MVNKLYCSKVSRVMSSKTVLTASYNVMCIEVIVSFKYLRYGGE